MAQFTLPEAFYLEIKRDVTDGLIAAEIDGKQKTPDDIKKKLKESLIPIILEGFTGKHMSFSLSLQYH